MKVVVLGLWHLGCVTAACCARHFEVIGVDFDPARLALLREGKAPIQEPGLDDLLQAGLTSARLRFTSDYEQACAQADVLWVTFDTPVDDDDRADPESVLRELRRCLPALPSGALVVLSSQLAVGTCRQLETEFGHLGHRFACSPENLRLGKAIDVFTQADRVVVGCRDEKAKSQLGELFAPFTSQIIWMSPESAEMTKHAVNSFLALSIAFMNEIARICELTGADAKEVERGLKSESRIGPKAYLSPGSAFAGGTLARDVVTLANLGEVHGETLEVLTAIKRSNDRHRLWAQERIQRLFPDRAGCRIALLGLTYKPGTNTLRRSSAVELARALADLGFEICAFDPSQSALPDELAFIRLEPNARAATNGVDATVICTEWPEFRRLDWPELVGAQRRPIVVDAARFVAQQIASVPRVRYVTVGSAA